MRLLTRGSGLALAALLLVPSCAPRRGAASVPRAPSKSPRELERGMASWYGDRFHGRKTASGEPYDMHELTAAHRTLPFGTLVEVENLDNGRKVVVRINDRGPRVAGRIIDLSYAAAAHLGIVQAGVAPVAVYLVE